jgi:hypothetical protein
MSLLRLYVTFDLQGGHVRMRSRTVHAAAIFTAAAPCGVHRKDLLGGTEIRPGISDFPDGRVGAGP